MHLFRGSEGVWGNEPVSSRVMGGCIWGYVLDGEGLVAELAGAGVDERQFQTAQRGGAHLVLDARYFHKLLVLSKRRDSRSERSHQRVTTITQATHKAALLFLLKHGVKEENIQCGLLSTQCQGI